MKKLTSLTLAALMAFSAAGVTAMADDPSGKYYETIFEENFDSTGVGYGSTDWMEAFNTNSTVLVKAKDTDSSDHYAEVSSSTQARLRSDDDKKIEFKAGKKYRLSFSAKALSGLNTGTNKCMIGIMGTSGYAIVNRDDVTFNKEWTDYAIDFDGQDVKNFIYFSAQGINAAHSYAIDNVKLEKVVDAPASVDPTATIVESTKAVYNGTGEYAAQTAVGFVAELIANDGSINALGVKVGNDDRGTQPITVLTNATAHVGVVVKDADADSAIDLYIK